MSSQYGELGPLAAEICWRVWGTAANFNEVRVLASLLQLRCSPEAKQTLHDVWTSPRLVCIHFRGLLAIMFLPFGFYLSSFFFFFFPRIISADVYNASAPGVALDANLECRLKCAARGSLTIQDAKMRHKIAICAPSHKFLGLYLRS